MSVSGRAGLFTIDPRFSFDLRDDVHTAPKRQKSGALRLEFGQLTLSTSGGVDGMVSAAVKTTVNTGITVVTTPHTIPTPVNATSGSISGNWAQLGAYQVGNTGAFVSAEFGIWALATGQFSGDAAGINVSYMVVGY